MMHRLLALTFSMMFLIAHTAVWSQAEPWPGVPWQELFNGRNLSGWERAPFNGKAEFRVEDGAIVGITKMGELCSYLVTEKMYGNFVLEFEFMIDEGLNSGMHLRSHYFPEYEKGHYHGYQAELAGGGCGGIFDEMRRGWIHPIARDRQDLEYAWRSMDWNELRVEAVGGRIRTWLNGVPSANLGDSLTLAGTIAIQLHNTLKRNGDKIRYRGIRIKDLDRARTRGGDPFAGPWKGATNNASKGIYARIENADGVYRACMYHEAEMSGAPAAVLTGKAGADGVLRLSGEEGWRGEIRGDRFTGRGRQNAIRLVDKEKIVETTERVIDVTFVMMPGSFEYDDASRSGPL